MVIFKRFYGDRTVIQKITETGNPPSLTVALAGNPNTGKSTLFNALTGLKQHTGNWSGKTVMKAQGFYYHRSRKFTLVDLPGTYSLLANSVEEQVARDFICFTSPDVTVVVVDATSLERNLNLALQVMEITTRVVLCVNLIDEAERKRISINFRALAGELGLPVVAAAAREGRGLMELKDVIYDVATGAVQPSPKTVTYDPEIERIVNQVKNRLACLLPEELNPRWVALRLIGGDEGIIDVVSCYLKATATGERHIDA